MTQPSQGPLSSGNFSRAPAKSPLTARVTGTLAAAAFAGGAVLFASYRRDLAAARKAIATGSEIAETAQGPVEYALAGKGPAALVIHGAGGGWDQGLMLGEMLGAGYRVIAPSRFGYLRTPLSADGSPTAQADAHAALLDSLRLGRVVVVGVSAGAPSAIQFALRYPHRVRALILLVPRAYAPDATVEVRDSASNRIILRLIEQGADFAFWLASRFVRKAVVRFLGVPPALEERAPADERARVTRLISSIQPLSARLSGLQNDGELVMAPWPLEEIKLPTLIVSAKDDLFNTEPAARYTAEKIHGAELIILKDGGHLFVNRRVEVVLALAEFLRSLGPDRSLRAA